ncbi:uncharacterized protein LOC134275790 [Saccostrea cucullata]|uniref:uncharacterized protein LOC134275790 n=1 Tax=Saccostrea cuccullata TaxID=36930 RepID=UPI002ED4E287
MVSAKTLNQVEFILRKTRNSEKIFGGIQVVLCGDFYQLPPVANELYGDQGKHCFNAVYFDKTFPHRVNLHTVYRQTEQDLISAVNELAQGSVSDATKAIILSLNRPLPAQIDVQDIVYLFCRNVDADIHNYKVITDIPGDLVTFTSEDTGDNHYLSKMLASKHLGVKVGVKVILLTNLSDDLVNGKMGIVQRIEGDLIYATFTINGKDSIYPIRKFTFTTYDPVTRSILSKRVQFPLKPSYGLTIHKSQGMSLKYVVVDCQNCFIPGQIGVAVGRATSVEGLKILNFKSSHVIQHHQSVYAYYKTCNVGNLIPNKSCCQGHTYNEDQDRDDREDLVGEDIGDDDDDDDDDDDPSTVNTRTEGDTGQVESDSDFSDFPY